MFQIETKDLIPEVLARTPWHSVARRVFRRASRRGPARWVLVLDGVRVVLRES